LPALGGSSIVDYTQQFDNAAWVPLTDGAGTGAAPAVTADASTAPDGSLTADLISIPARSATTRRQIIYNVTDTPSAVDYTGSLYVKARTGSDVGKAVSIQLWNGTTGTNAIVTLSDSWQRAVAINTLVASASVNNFAIGRDSAVSGIDAVEFYAWQGQAIIGNFPDGGTLAVRTA
jgi:hypothetical protein